MNHTVIFTQSFSQSFTSFGSASSILSQPLGQVGTVARGTHARSEDYLHTPAHSFRQQELFMDWGSHSFIVLSRSRSSLVVRTGNFNLAVLSYSPKPETNQSRHRERERQRESAESSTSWCRSARIKSSKN